MVQRKGLPYKVGMRTSHQRAISKALGILLPGITFADAAAIQKAAMAPHMRTLPASIAVWLATIAYVRHIYTDYDQLLDEGYDRDSARHFVYDAINSKLIEWRATRYLDEDDNGQSL